jgi:DNA mismatch repair protein MutS
LVLIDEIGRGTATTDGLALATAISEWLHDRIGCKTVFATHFHQLTHLEGKKQGAFCLSVGVIERDKEIIFTHRIEARAADRSYGIEVARLAGLPEGLLERAEQVLFLLDEENCNEEVRSVFERELAGDSSAKEYLHGGLLPLAERLSELNPDKMTPLQALCELVELRQIALANK